MDASAIAELQQLEKPRRLERSARVQTSKLELHITKQEKVLYKT